MQEKEWFWKEEGLKPPKTSSMSQTTETLVRNMVQELVTKISEQGVQDKNKLFNHSASLLFSCGVGVSSSSSSKNAEEEIHQVIDQETIESRISIVKSINAQECISYGELSNLLATKTTPICYDGFEPSGRMHIAQGVMKTLNANKLTDAGIK